MNKFNLKDSNDCGDEGKTKDDQTGHAYFQDSHLPEFRTGNQSEEEDQADNRADQDEYAAKESFISFGTVDRVLMT